MGGRGLAEVRGGRMKDKELWLNGSGYPDPTAYKAMKGMVDMENRVGEVWKVNTHKGTKTELVVAEKYGAFALLEMFDELKDNTDLTVNVNGEDMHTNSIMMSYCFDSRFVDKVGTLSDDDFTMVLETIGRTFNVPMMPVTDFVKAAHANTVEKNAEIERLKANVEALEIMVDNRNEQITCLKVERDKLKSELSEKTTNDGYELRIERDMYKKLYEIAVDRLARKAVGANAV